MVTLARWTAAVVAVLAVGACSSGDDLEPRSFQLLSLEDRRVAVGPVCHEHVVLTAEESAGAVTLRLEVAEYLGDCLGCAGIELASNVGDRVIVDATTGEPVPLDPTGECDWALDLED